MNPGLRGGGHGVTNEQNTRGSDAQSQAGQRRLGGRPTTRNVAHAHIQHLEQERPLNGLIFTVPPRALQTVC